ncbi:MAG TPA: PAS domain S-box protein [Methanocella sp.]|uniref:PAS domain-containing protein n=1 Tax=Methanocella sp. TaxID=2052833 RepID=UPI002BD6C60E|nr:PAS domain S-box protein [Methanocella sp.]HTY90476.1 PAS domain S-box protein [Methanocella sp.]
MVPKSVFRKKSESVSSEGAVDKDRLIAELKRRIAVLEKKNDDLAALNGKLRGLSQAVEQSASVVVITDTTGSIQYVNPKFTELTGYSFEEAIGKNPRILKTGETPPEEYKQLWETIKSGREWRGVFHNKKKNGDLYWESAIISPVMDDCGKITNFMAVKEDITERKQMEDVLRESEEKFHILADSTYDWVAWNSPAGNYIYVSPSCERMTGHGADEFYHDPGLMKRIVHPDDLTAFEQHIDSYLCNASLCGSFDFRIISTSGETRWINHVCRPVFKDNGEWLGRRASNRDITERKRAEDALRVSEERLRRASIAGRIGLFEWNVDRDKIYFSSETYELFGLEPGSPGTYETWLQGVHPDDRETVERTLTEAHEKARNMSRISTQIEFRLMHPDGAVRWLEATATYDLEGDDLMMRGTVRDITERKRAEKELDDYRKRLEDLVQERTRKLDEEKRLADLYVDLMCHDISNMNQVGLGFLEIALDMLDLDEAGKEMLLRPRSAFEGSSKLIDNVRKLRMVKSCECQYKKMDIGEVLKSVQDNYSKQYGNATIRNHAGVGYMVQANELLYDLFSNLVGNAIKHSKGDPVVDISVQPSTEDGHEYYRVSIDDRGPGIPDSIKAGIFERKLTGDVKTKGSGIGLLMVKTLVDSYKGLAWVEDRVKGDHTQGARFVVILPAV